MEKKYKNVNMIRTNHYVSRLIRTATLSEAVMVASICKPIMVENYEFQIKKGWYTEEPNDWIVDFFCKATDWNGLVKKHENLILDPIVKYNRRKYWFLEERD